MSKRNVDSDESPLHEQPTKITRTVKCPLQHQDDDDEMSMRIQQMLGWLQKLGADFSYVEIAPSANGGFGAFSRIEIPSNGTIAKIPNQAIMSIGKSKRSRVGQACHDVFMGSDLKPNGEFILWLDMIHGRRDPNHFHHPYLAALPPKAPDVPAWTPQQRTRLQGTNLGVAAEQTFKELEDQFDSWMPHISNVHPELFGSIALSDFVWARGMYFSRRFPTVLLANDDDDNKTGGASRVLDTPTSGGRPIPTGPISIETNETKSLSVGIMLPFFDLLNHDPHQPITWSGSNTHVTFSTGPQSIPVGSEIYNNYGPKGNEMLLMMYGFALRNNCHDNYGLHLVKMTLPKEGSDGTTSSATNRISLGTFQIHRIDSPINPQFPPELWRALNQMFEEDLEEEAGSANGTCDKDDDNGRTMENDNIEIGLEVVEILLDTLRQRLLPLESTREVDCRLDDFVSIYRDGQRVVLEQAIETLEGMIPDPQNTEDEDDQDDA